MSEDLRVMAMQFALDARANAEEDVVALAERIHAFLVGCSQARPDNLPPPLPSQLGPESLSSAPPGLRPEGFARGDQTPPPVIHDAAGKPLRIGENCTITMTGNPNVTTACTFGEIVERDSDNIPTRIVTRTDYQPYAAKQFTE